MIQPGGNMKYCVVLFASLLVPMAFANPVLRTIVNEFGFYTDSLGWVELHVEPLDDEQDLTGWQLTTSTSVCTLDYDMPYGGFLVVDSASIAEGTYAHGTFRLNPAGDHIELIPDSPFEVGDSVAFPVLPAGQNHAPAPPISGSASLLNDASINWYIDSTPTRAMNNDDYSSVTGTVTWAPGRNFYLVEVLVSGPMGGSYSSVAARYQSYLAPGLSAGRYAVTALGQPGNVSAAYPDSVDVGYSATLSGINLDFDPEAVAETVNDERGTMNVGPTVLSGAMVQRLKSSVVFDAMGRRVVSLKPGVYFVREAQAQARAVRKVVVRR
jgi:hypothetical protein